MVTIASLWLPILLGGVFCFVASSVIHMLLGYHKNDYRPVPDENAAIEAIRGLDIPPGDYVFPWAGTTEAMNSDDFRQKAEQGPVMFFTILKPGAMLNMGPQMAQWFAYCVLVSVVAAQRRDPNPVGWRRLPGGLPAYGHRGVRLLRDGSPDPIDLVQAELGYHGPQHVRWPRVRLPHGRGLRVALALM